MKFLPITFSLLIVGSVDVNAQKFGHFSSDHIIKQMPTYRDAQLRIDSLSLLWMEEVKDKYIAIGRLESKLEVEKVLLTEEMLKERENEIAIKLKDAIAYHSKVFGPDGLFFLKKKELIRPELDKVYEAVERVCKKHRLDYLFDKSSELIMVYTNPVHDYTDYILEELGLVDSDVTVK